MSDISVLSPQSEQFLSADTMAELERSVRERRLEETRESLFSRIRKTVELVVLAALSIIVIHFFVKFMVQELYSAMHFSNTDLYVEPAGY